MTNSLTSGAIHLVFNLGDSRALCGQRASAGCTDKKAAATCSQCLVIEKAGKDT